MKVQSKLLFLCVLAAGTGTAAASEPLQLVSASFMGVDAQLDAAQGHPNEEWRYQGLKSYLGGHYEEAIGRFERAAGYADKYSQHYLSLIYWHGQGVAPDRVRGYIWSDLAAERGGRKLLAIRENMWAQLTPEQRQQAVAQGAAFYDRYGDAVAQPRAEAEIRRYMNSMTGSRVGYRNQMIDIANGGPPHGTFGNATAAMMAAATAANGGTTGERAYADDRVKVRQYWAVQDLELDQSGRVQTGPVGSMRKGDQL